MSGGDRLRVVAHFPGRLRVRADMFRVLPEVAADVARLLADEPGVSSVSTSPLTGSMLIVYDPHETQLLRLLRAVLRVSGLPGVEVDGGHFEDGAIGRGVRKAADALDGKVRHAARGKLDLRTGVPGGLVLLGVGKLLLGKWRSPEWYDLVFWSLTTFWNLNPPEGGGAPIDDLDDA